MFVINWKIVNQIACLCPSDMLELNAGWLVGLMVFNATFQHYFSYIVAVSFIAG